MTQLNIDRNFSEKQELDVGKYSLGWFDGLIGLDPEEIESNSYRYGYYLGKREYLATKRGIQLPAAA